MPKSLAQKIYESAFPDKKWQDLSPDVRIELINFAYPAVEYARFDKQKEAVQNAS